MVYRGLPVNRGGQALDSDCDGVLCVLVRWTMVTSAGAHCALRIFE
jgi:hypothetical protein